jgi:hypothetical protein
MQHGVDRDLGATVAAQMLEVCDRLPVVCTENLIRVDAVMESPKLAE